MKKGAGLSVLFLVTVVVLLIMPVIVTLIYSFVKGWVGIFPTGFTLQHYQDVSGDARVIPSIFRAFIISIVPIMIGSFFVILALYTAILYCPWLDKYIQGICMLPNLVNGVVLAISTLSLYAGSPTPFSNRLVMLTCAYCIIILPYIYQGIRNNLHAVNIRQLIEAAEILGASKLYAFLRIVVPNIVSGILVSALLGMSVIFTDYVMVKIIAGSRYLTAQQLLYNYRNKPGQFTSVMVLISFVIIFIISGTAYAMQNRNSKRFQVKTTEE
jgi:putative spermidine/putrescine transport system permease protein